MRQMPIHALRALLLMLLMVCSGAVLTCAFAEAEIPDLTGAVEIAAGQAVHIELEGDALYSFQAASNSVYGVYLFAEDDSSGWTDAVLYSAGGGELAQAVAGERGSLALVARLAYGERYVLRLHGNGPFVLEVDRQTLGRCHDMPLRLDDRSSYSKLIVDAGDAHWYAFSAEEDALVTVRVFPDVSGEVRLSAALIDGDGGQVTRSISLDEGAAALWQRMRGGSDVFLRVQAEAGETGGYRVEIVTESASAAPPDALKLSAESLELSLGGRARLQASLPEGSAESVIWRSSNSAAVVVTDSGEVIAVSAGEADVSAWAWGGVRAVCHVVCEGVPLEGVRFDASEINLVVGEARRAEYGFLPIGAYTKDVTFWTEDVSVATVDKRGHVRAESEGQTTLHISAEDGKFTHSIPVYVEAAPSARRALIVAEQIYKPDVNKTRIGAAFTAESLRAAIAASDADGAYTSVEVLLDVTRDGLVSAIQEAFREAEPEDVSMLYITCHGDYVAGMSYLQFVDGSLISAVDLERVLRDIPGTVVVLIDCCSSGGFLGKAATAEDFNQGIIAPFSGIASPGALTGSKYKVLTSAWIDEDSYRISFDSSARERTMATVFVRAIAEGCGWSIDRETKTAMRADADGNGCITLEEMYIWASKRVVWTLNLAKSSYSQHVQVWPEGDAFGLFGSVGQPIGK